MGLNIWIVIGIVFIVIWALIGWEAWASPMYDQDGNPIDKDRDVYQDWLDKSTREVDKERDNEI